MDARDWRFPTPCPSCEAMTGTPYRVQTDAPILTLTLRCDDCGHEWEISAPAPPLFFKPRPDRRKSSRAKFP